MRQAPRSVLQASQPEYNRAVSFPGAVWFPRANGPTSHHTRVSAHGKPPPGQEVHRRVNTLKTTVRGPSVSQSLMPTILFSCPKWALDLNPKQT